MAKVMQVSSSRQGLPISVFVRKYASPGIDGTTDVGVLSSGAGQLPDDVTGIQNASPYDWSPLNPNIGHETGYLIGGIEATKSQNVSETRSRKRGTAVFGGYFTGRTGASQQNPGGSVDLNAGADSLIAGGKAQASSMVRFNGRNPNNMRLPIIPNKVSRKGAALLPSGGQSPGFGPAAPTLPQLKQFNSIIRVIQR